MGKYDPLKAYLGGRGNQVVMTFDEIAALVGGLPASAREYEAWWNDYDSTHSQCKAWNDAGYVAEPHLKLLQISFSRQPG